MNPQKFSEALGQIDDHYLEEAMRYRKLLRWKHWAALAACAAVLFAGLEAREPPPPHSTEPFQTEPPTWTAPHVPETIPPGRDISDGSGFEGYLVYDIDQLQTGCPWEPGGEGLETLPVFAYLVTPDIPDTAATPEQMRSLIYEAFGRLDIPPEAVLLDETNPERFTGTAAGFSVEVSNYLVGTLEFPEPISLPDGYSFGLHSTYGELAQTADWILENYSHLLGFEAPVAVIEGGDYTFSGEQGYTLSFREGAGTLDEQIIRFGSRILIGHDNSNRLTSIQLQGDPQWENLGDYPVRTVDEAIAALWQGDYYTDVPYPLTGQEEFAKIDLVYRRWQFETCCMPYYRLFVELPQEQQGELKTYGVYYVPAVEYPQP